jgi:hypothetical protein
LKKQFIERLPIPDLRGGDEEALGEIAEEITQWARDRHALHRAVRHRLLTDLPPAKPTTPPKLNNALTAWWTLDFPALRREATKAIGADIPVRERADWEASLAGWRGEHDLLTAKIIAREEEMNDRVYRAFGLSAADVLLLEDHMKRTKTFYPLGEV